MDNLVMVIGSIIFWVLVIALYFMSEKLEKCKAKRKSVADKVKFSKPQLLILCHYVMYKSNGFFEEGVVSSFSDSFNISIKDIKNKLSLFDLLHCAGGEYVVADSLEMSVYNRLKNLSENEAEKALNRAIFDSISDKS